MLIALALLILTALVFGFAPHLDIAAARLFLTESGGFLGVSPTGEMLRRLGFGLPFGLLGLAVAGWVMRRAGLKRFALPSGRAALFLALTMALGPGLLVNVTLKDHSHRPRPVQTQELGGPWTFRPWYRFDGACKHNCSFVSGEASSAFWTLAPALLVPPPFQPLAIAASLTFGAGVAVLRMAFGGHYLSDSLFSALLTILLVLGFHRLFFGPKPPKPTPEHDPDLREQSASL